MADITNRDAPRLGPVTGRTVLFSLIGFFGVIALVNGIMIHAAVSTFGGVETSSSYQAGLAFAREIEAARSQEALHWRVDATFRTEAGATVLDVEVRDASGRPLGGLDARAWLAHPTDRRADRDVTFREAPPGHFSAAIGTIAGQRDLIVELSRDGERLFRSRNRVVLH